MPMRWQAILLTAAVGAVSGFAGSALWGWSGMGHSQIREYMVANPEILPEMARELQNREATQRLSSIADAVNTPFPGAVLGNPKGSVTLVEFSDYACVYCRQTMPDVEALVAADPDLRVVIREWPIFQGSDASARMALAAAKQGKYAEFHAEMFAKAPPTEENIIAAAKAVGLDIERARKDAASREIELELAKNQALAQQLGFTGTPSWVTGNQVFEGAVGRAGLAQAVEDGAGS